MRVDPSHQGERKIDVPAIYCLRIHPDLKDKVAEAASEAGLAMNEFIAVILADHLNVPELAKIPRKPLGRRADVQHKPNGKTLAKVR